MTAEAVDGPVTAAYALLLAMAAQVAAAVPLSCLTEDRSKCKRKDCNTGTDQRNLWKHSEGSFLQRFKVIAAVETS